MYCPQCGQQQISGEVRFCSRCGFPLDGVSMLLTTRGVIPAIESDSRLTGTSPRRRGVRQGGALMLIGLIVTPLLIFLHEVLGLPEEFVMLAAILFFWGGILRILYALIFQEGERDRKLRDAPMPYVAPAVPAQLGAARSDAAGVPPGQARMRAASFMSPRSNTAEIVPPPSVADHTTRLLDKQTDPTER